MDAMRRVIFLIFSSLLFSNSAVWGMGVDEAYRAIPHQRTVFNSSRSNIDLVERHYLTIFFSLIDKAVVARVEGVRAIRAGKEPNMGVYRSILVDLDALSVPGRLRAAQGFVREAISDQGEALQRWSRNPSLLSNIAGDPSVASASNKLHRAYSELMRLYPSESKMNKQAFFDYLCALDYR